MSQKILLGVLRQCRELKQYLNFGLAGSAASVPTALHDATVTRTDYILNSCSLNFRLPGSPTHEGKFPTHVPGNCMQRGLQEHRWEMAFGSFLYDPVLWARPGWFEDSFSLKCGLPGNAGSVPTVLHDATDTGTDYIFGGGQGCQNDTQGLQNSRKMNPARLV